MDGTKVGVFEQSNQISFCSFLQGHNCCALESDFATQRRGDYLVVRCNFSHQSLEGQLSYQEFCGLLVLPNLLQGNSSRLISVTLFHSVFWSLLATFIWFLAAAFLRSSSLFFASTLFSSSWASLTDHALGFLGLSLC